MKRGYLNRVSKPKKYTKLKWQPRKKTCPRSDIWSLDKCDTEYSRYVREKANWKCEKCGVKDIPPTKFIQCSHYIGRAEKATRYDEDNTDVLCDPCHKFFEGCKNGEYKTWKINKLGKEKHDCLLQKANKGMSERDSIIGCMKIFGKEPKRQIIKIYD